MQRRIKNIERLYLYIPLIYLIIATVGTVSLLFRISPDFRGTLLPYVNVLDNLYHNIYHAPIIDLAAIPSNRICPHPYTTLPISSWPGTDSGVYNKNNKTIYKGTADSLKIPYTELRKDWVEIPAQQKKLMKNWGAYQLCAFYGDARSVNFNTSTCSPGYKLCSNGVICVLYNLPCPISSVEFDWDPSGHQLRMKVERNNSKDAIAFIEASVNGLPCLNPTKAHPISRNEKFPLEGKPNTGCDQFGEYKESLHVIDEEPLSQFYKENGLPLMSNTDLNYEKYLEGSKIVLVSKTKERLAVKPICAMVGPTLSGINQMIKNFSFEGTIAPSLMAYHLAVLIFGYVMLCFLYFDKENEEREKYIKQQKHVFNAFHFIPYILCLLFIAEYSEVPENGSPKVEVIKANLDVLINNQCIISDQYNEVFAGLKHTVIGMNDYYFGMSESMGVLSYSFILIMLLVKGVRGYYRKEIEEFETSFLEARFDMIRGQETVIDPAPLNQVQIELSEDIDGEGEYDEEEVYAAYLQYIQEQRGGETQQNRNDRYEYCIEKFCMEKNC